MNRVFCSGVATAPLKQASNSPTVMPVGGILDRTSSPVGKGAVCVSAGGGGEGPGREGVLAMQSEFLVLRRGREGKMEVVIPSRGMPGEGIL